MIPSSISADKMFVYSVKCTLPSASLAEEYIAWLRDGHLTDVVAAGASTAEAIRFDGEPTVVESRYTFSDREAFSAYERDHAPTLRAEGLTRFPPDLGLQFTRATGFLIG